MSAAVDVCRCLSPEDWRDGLCGYCGRQRRSLYPESEAVVVPDRTLADELRRRQADVLLHLQGLAAAVRRLPGASLTVTDEALVRLAGLSVTVNPMRQTIELDAREPVLLPPLEPPENVR